ncbi:YolD-like family protein [Alkalicoccobacillus porphyridii]|uniref:YolD-like family protein n=1 Tax=Alkalicoccobacillus porphyridii TaxID=2597270 RepID=A0A553ZVJ0_9BACI|nr:YolD-like family protein [Alkalicoccobacillus porphyridii]TSB45326.1 YolD-like family protein [Alkalicoccobacillus porphyridii]
MSDYLRRENLLWEGSRMMLPEHKQAIRAQNEYEKRVNPPLLDEQELEELGIVAMESLSYSLPIHVEYWEDGYYKKLIAVVERVNEQSKQVSFREGPESIVTVEIQKLKSIERI